MSGLYLFKKIIVIVSYIYYILRYGSYILNVEIWILVLIDIFYMLNV